MAEVKQARIFLSYARKDVAEVNKLYDRLKRYGFSPWQDHKDLIGGVDWMEEIIETINHCAFFVACISKNTVDRQTGVLVREINEALEVVKYRRKGTVFIIPVRLENVDFPKEFKKYQGIDLFEPDGFEKLIAALRHGLKQLGVTAPLHLRSEPINDLSPADAAQMIKERNFYASNFWNGAGIHHEYELKAINGDKVIIDHTTGLMWQQAGSDRGDYQKAQEYIKKLNRDKFAGFNDWRLPTLEEAMSLMEREKRGTGLYIDPVFDQEQWWIWCADKSSASVAWVVSFDYGHCSTSDVGIYGDSVRGVRSGQSS